MLCDYFPGEPVPEPEHPLGGKPSPSTPSERPLAAWLHFHGSYCWSPERSAPCLHCPASVDCDEVTPQPPPRWTSQMPSAAPHKPCPQGLSASSSPSLELSLTVWCPPYAEVPRTAHRTRGGAAPVQSRVGQAPPSAVLCLTHFRTCLALWAATIKGCAHP